jgi:tryptophanyl-tRNA synthetase
MRILSGIQPSGRLHVGNYFGMMEPAIALQHEGEAFYFIADYHSLTSVSDPNELRQNVRDVAVDFLACGLNPEKAVFFRQSDVPEVAELSWILSTITPMGLLERCTSYKDKIARNQEATHALFSYPVLMAADILIYDSNVVPVGEDQKQHLEVTRDIAQKMNHRYGDIFVMPEARIGTDKAKVPGLDGQKMSKSYGNTLEVFGEQKPSKKKIMGIVTDSTPVEEPKNPEGSIIVDLYRLFASADDVAKMEADYRNGGIGYGEFKKRLFEAYWEFYQSKRAHREKLLAAPDYIDEVLIKGAEKARSIATVTMERVRKAVGLRTDL